MGQQHRVTVKRRRRVAYLARKKEAARAARPASKRTRARTAAPASAPVGGG